MSDATRKPKPRAVHRSAPLEPKPKITYPHGQAALLGIKTDDPAGLHQRVLDGLSFRAVETLRRAVGWPTQTVAEALQIPLRTLHRRKEEGRLRPDESDRLVRLSRLLAGAIGLFEGDTEAALLWLGTPLPALGGGTPLELAQTDPGSTQVELLIGRLEHGVFA